MTAFDSSHETLPKAPIDPFDLVGTWWRHYKGHVYEIKALARVEAEPSSFLVIYAEPFEDAEDVVLWSRPFLEFFGFVEGQSQRFTRVANVAEQAGACADCGAPAGQVCGCGEGRRERAKEVEHLQRRLAERRQAFRDVEHRAKTLAGAKKAIRAIGHKLMVARGALRKILESNDGAGAARQVAANALERIGELGRTGISASPPEGGAR